LNRQLPKTVSSNDGKVPKLYIRTVADLETLLLETVEKQKVTLKKMSTLSTKGMNAVRQKIRKINREFQTDIDAYREDKEAFMTEDVVELIALTPKTAKVRDVFVDGDTVDDGDAGGWEGVGRDGRPMKYTAESILKNLRDIVASRGRKNTDRQAQIRTMERLLEVAVTDYQKVRVLNTLISTRFDSTSGSTSYMAQDNWKM